MARHIQEFWVHSYKGINELKLSDFNSINILTGDNNSGKTSFLEILSTLNNPQDTGAWVLCSRQANPWTRNRRYFNGFYNMFPIDKDEKIISYEFKDAEGKKWDVSLHAETRETQVSEKEMYRLNALIQTETEKEDEIVDTVCLYLDTYLNGCKVNEYKIYDFQTLISRFINKKHKFVRTVYVSPVDHVMSNLYLDDILSDSELYEHLLNVLKQFDDNILNINAIKTEGVISSAEYVILTKNHKKALPLNAYGDGMKKAILLLSAIVRARDGILLLDEFETAIHTSAMDSVFSWLLKSAMKLNVQVFLTSHSKEAIEKVLKADAGLQEHINLYTLYKHEGRNLVRRMGCAEAINAQDRLGLELR